MVTFQRGGIAAEECARCQGVFLGRAELDRLLWRGPSHPQPACGHSAPFAYEGRHRRV